MRGPGLRGGSERAVPCRCERLPEDVERLTSELRILRAIDLALPAAANQRQDFVSAEAGPSSKGYRGWTGARLYRIAGRLALIPQLAQRL
jgi:hypothetical protein